MAGSTKKRMRMLENERAEENARWEELAEARREKAAKFNAATKDRKALKTTDPKARMHKDGRAVKVAAKAGTKKTEHHKRDECRPRPVPPAPIRPGDTVFGPVEPPKKLPAGAPKTTRPAAAFLAGASGGAAPTPNGNGFFVQRPAASAKRQKGEQSQASGSTEASGGGNGGGGSGEGAVGDRAAMVALYGAMNPTKVGEVDGLLAKYTGHEKAMWSKLGEKYGAAAVALARGLAES
jgi:hypothetical protein